MGITEKIARRTEMNANKGENKIYLGDGVYADYDGFGVVLTTENGIRVTNTIVLEPDALAALNQYYERMIAQREVLDDK
jgi:hypothetical protein